MPDQEKEPGVSKPKNEEEEKEQQADLEDETDDVLAIFPCGNALSPFE